MLISYPKSLQSQSKGRFHGDLTGGIIVAAHQDLYIFAEPTSWYKALQSQSLQAEVVVTEPVPSGEFTVPVL